MFDGIIKATVHTKILDQTLVPFINMFTPVHTSLWPMTILSIHHGMHKGTLRRRGSIGGICTPAELPRRLIPA